MFKLCVLAIVLSVAGLASVDGAVAVYRYSYPPYYPFHGLEGVVSTVPVVGSKVADGKIEGVSAISSYLIDPHYYGYPYAGYPYYPSIRLVRNADKSVEQIESKIEEPIAENSSEDRVKRSPKKKKPARVSNNQTNQTQTPIV